jgi:hypothetical protein
MKAINSSTIRIAASRTWLLVAILMGLVVSTAWGASSAAQSTEKKAATPTTITTGSGNKYKTTVDQKAGGELSAEDFRQASLLASRIVLHVNEAVEDLDQDRAADARAAVQKGLELAKLVRDLLPTTEVTTSVRDSKGTEVYRNVDRVQNDRIPLHEGLVAVKVVEAITDAKRDAASVKGVRLADADLVHTSVLLELDYVEGRLKRALNALPAKPADALKQLVLAQSQGVTFSVNKEDNPLVAAQLALQLAEQMVKEDQVEAAKANLQLAKNQLVLYRGLVGKHESDDVKKLEEDISKLQGNIETADAAANIRGFWDRVANWFSREHREMRTTSDVKKEKSGG